MIARRLWRPSNRAAAWLRLGPSWIRVTGARLFRAGGQHDASSLIRAKAATTWVDEDGDLDDVPDIVVTITCAAERRALSNPDGVTQESVGSYQVGYANATSNVYLTRDERWR